ncbi:hypothetical protein MSAN_00354100 [Mycena sanguinolenta]|uniref:Uncharacterized protein n=1 Tax=Mycena sanguinolenta TaxID=230812 RepID=A0A8H6ZEA3_9AGAR|nr:hypothetical protein MSAN_00354100 [Mycena sanguinolenta]
MHKVRISTLVPQHSRDKLAMVIATSANSGKAISVAELLRLIVDIQFIILRPSRDERRSLEETQVDSRAANLAIEREGREGRVCGRSKCHGLARGSLRRLLMKKRGWVL